MPSTSQASPSNVPSVSLLINVTAATTNSASIQSVASAVRQSQLPTTWIVDQPRQAQVLAAAVAEFESAALITARSPQRLRSELANLQAGLLAVTGKPLSVVAGDPQQLRSRAAMLADLGISAVLPDQLPAAGSKPPRQLPCGLWQLDPTISLPQQRGRWSLLPTRRPSLSQAVGGATCIVSLDLAQASSRDLQSFTRLLEEAAQGRRDQQLNVVRVSQLAAQLAQRNEVKPQRSILRRAA